MLDSASLTTPMITQGRLLDAAGRPATGFVRLQAWPAWSPSDPVGSTTELPLVAWSTAGPDGTFALRAPSEAGLAGLSEPDGDTVNFVLFATSGDLRYEHHFFRRLPDATRASGNDKGEAAEPIEIRFDPRSESVDRRPTGAVRPAAPVGWPCHTKELGRYPGQETLIGELGTTEGVNGTFSYVNRADSTVSVAVRLGDQWGTRGEHHVSNEQTARYIQEVRYPESHAISSFFTYVRREVACDGEGFATSEELSAEYWDGGGKLIPKYVPSCLGSQYSRPIPAGSQFARDRNRAETWKGAAHVLGAEFSASSGYSTNVSAAMEFR